MAHGIDSQFLHIVIIIIILLAAMTYNQVQIEYLTVILEYIDFSNQLEYSKRYLMIESYYRYALTSAHYSLPPLMKQNILEAVTKNNLQSSGLLFIVQAFIIPYQKK